MVDLHTLLVAMLVAAAVLAAMLGLASGREPRPGFTSWNLSLTALALAFALFAAPGEFRSGALVLATTLLGLAFSLQAQGLLAFAERNLPTWVHTSVIAGVAAPVALFGRDIAAVTLFVALVFGTLLVLLAAISWQLPARSSPLGRLILAGSYALAAATFYVRGIGVLFAVDPLQAFVAPNALQSLGYLALFGVFLAASCGFLLLHKERADAEASRLASLDPLTGAYNRGSFDAIAARAMARAERAGQPLSIILLDIDHFGAMVEASGQPAGDSVLKRVAEIVRAALRQEDMLVRASAGEFLVMLPEVAGPGAVVVAGRIRRNVAEEIFEIEGQAHELTVSAGVAARLDEGPESMDELVRRAAEALSLAKRRGRNRVVALSLGRSIAA